MVHIPYGKTHIDFEEQGAGVLTSRIGELKAEGSGSDIVRAAMENPIDSPRLCELAKGKKNCVIIIFRPYAPGAEQGHHPQYAA